MYVSFDIKLVFVGFISYIFCVEVYVKKRLLDVCNFWIVFY